MSWYSSVPSVSMLTTWIDNNYNVLFHGRHGVGKTSMIFEAFARRGWEINTDYLYFSAATIDPWVDLIGVPTKVQNEEGVDVIKLIRPENIKNHTIKAFFVDELNRSHKKVRNAMMELIQFKSINGLRFPNLEIVWAAVNPSEDADLQFDVEKLDPAQEDRFQIQVQIPYKPNELYFAQKYNNPEMAEAVCKWWNDQPEKVKLEITPRRLEYAIDVFHKTHDLRFVMPSEAHISSLKTAIQTGNPEKTLLKLLETQDETQVRKWLAVENNLTSVQNLICKNRAVCNKVLHLLSEERLTAFAIKHKMVVEQIKSEPQKYEKIVRDLAQNSTNKSLKETCASLLPYLDASVTKLKNIYIPKKANTILTKRQKKQLFNNYALRTDANISHVNNAVEKIANTLLSLATEVCFANNSSQRNEILLKLADIVHPNMDVHESTVCLRILDYVFSNVEDAHDIARNMPLLNSCLLSYIKSHDKEVSVEELYNSFANVVTNILLHGYNNMDEFKLDSDDLIMHQVAHEEFFDVANEHENVRKQTLEDLF